MTSFKIKCSPHRDKSQFYYLSSSDISVNSSPEIQGKAYSQEEYDRFLCGLNFKTFDGGFFGAEAKFCTNCDQNSGVLMAVGSIDDEIIDFQSGAADYLI